MSTMKDKSKKPEPIRGRVENAVYRVPEEFKQATGNPLIEALPAPWDWDAPAPGIAEKLTQFFKPDRKALETASGITRLFQLAEFKTQYFQVLQRHRDLEQSLSLAIRFGYLGRNPMDLRHRRNIHDRVERFRQPVPNFIAASNLGFVLLGSPGLGKTTSVGRIAQLYPQVIIHDNERLPNTKQLVWLFLTCPHDKSTKALCLQFFKEVDEILGTTYQKEYSRHTEDGLLAAMATVASILSLGVLFIDEIQFLDPGKSGGKADLLKFIVQMQNTLGIPIVLVGTHKAGELVAGGPHQSRRSVGLGGRTWARLAEDDPEWDLFLKSLWVHQYQRNYVALTPELAKKMYFETQGILTYAVDLFFFAQLNAINDGIERFTEESLEWAAMENMEYNRPYILALRSGDKVLASVLEDIEPMNYENCHAFFAERLKLPPPDDPEPPADAKPDKSTPPPNNSPSTGTDAAEPGPKIPGFHPAAGPLPAAETTPTKRKRRRGKKLDYPPGTIMAICENAAHEHDIAPYEALQNADLIRNASEFLPVASAAG